MYPKVMKIALLKSSQSHKTQNHNDQLYRKVTRTLLLRFLSFKFQKTTTSDPLLSLCHLHYADSNFLTFQVK